MNFINKLFLKVLFLCHVTLMSLGKNKINVSQFTEHYMFTKMLILCFVNKSLTSNSQNDLCENNRIYSILPMWMTFLNFKSTFEFLCLPFCLHFMMSNTYFSFLHAPCRGPSRGYVIFVFVL